MYIAKVLADSVSPEGVRLTTLEVEYPHAIHKDIMTHRVLSRNFQSFRAYPPEQVIANIMVDPFVPESFDKRVKGMGQGEALENQERGQELWQQHIDHSISIAQYMIKEEMAKAQVNFILQDLTWIRGIITATEWENFFGLRLAIDPKTGEPFARPEVFKIAQMMQDAMDNSTPRRIEDGYWHLPLVDTNEFHKVYSADHPIGSIEKLKLISAGRCARVSYLTHDGVRDFDADIELARSLLKNGHMSPFEHQATPFGYRSSDPDFLSTAEWSGNFYGWQQFRKEIPNEENYTKVLGDVD